MANLYPKITKDITALANKFNDMSIYPVNAQDYKDLFFIVRQLGLDVSSLTPSSTTPTLDQVTTAGNTTANTIDVGGVTTDYVQLDTLATPTLQPGMFAWNDADGTADLRLKGNNVTLQLGQEEVIRVVNKTGADLLEADFKPVRVRSVAEGGAQGQRLAVVLAQADSDTNSATTIGIVTENIANNQEGFITVSGNVNGIDTTGAKSYGGLETWVDGDILYLNPDHAGYLTNVKPITPAHLIVMGWVVYAHQNQGKIFVKVDNGYELEELHDVLVTGIADQDLLQWDASGPYWKNVPVSTAVPTPTLDQVTNQGNTTDNSISIGSLHVNGGPITNYNQDIPDIGVSQTSDFRGYGDDYIAEKTLAYTRIGAQAFDEEGAIRIQNGIFQTYVNGGWSDVATGFRFRQDPNGNYEFEHKPTGFQWWIEVSSGNSDILGLNGLPLVQNYAVSMGAYPVPLEIDGGTF